MLPLWKTCLDSPMKNAIVLCTSFLFVFTGYNCSVNLLSSLNIQEGLGVASQSVLYAAFILGAVTVPPLCMKTFGIKNSIVISAALYSPYVAANFYPSWYTFLPSAVLIGLAAGPLWAAGMAYLTAMAKRRGTSKGDSNPDDTIFFFLGLLFTFFGFSNVFGNLVSFFILQPEGGYSDLNVSRQDLDLCGINFCDWTAIQSDIIKQPPKEKVWLLTAIYAACVLFGALLAFVLLDNMDLSEVGVETEETGGGILDLVMAPLLRFKVIEHWYILPITVFAGVEESFLFGDYTKAYIACSWGIYHIGLSMMICGLVLCLASFFLGSVVKVIDRAYLFLSAGLIHAVGIVLLWYWTPDTPKYVLYIIPAIWGLVTAVWQSQVRAMYGVLFPDAKGASFAVHAALEALGFLIGFAISARVCTEPKLWLLVVLLVLSMIGYAAAEVSHRRSRAQNVTITTSANDPNKCKNF